MTSEILVIGIGNLFCGDDGVGLMVAQKLRALALPAVTVLEQSGEGTALLEAWAGGDWVIVVDAVSSGSQPGTIHRLEVGDQPLPGHFSGGSTHAFGLAEAVELGRQLDRLPAQLTIFGIEGQAYDLATGLSLEVEMAAQKLVEQIGQELGK